MQKDAWMNGIGSVAGRGGYVNKGGTYDDSVANSFTINATHSHSVSITNTGGNGYHENRMPYVAVNFWRRTA